MDKTDKKEGRSVTHSISPWIIAGVFIVLMPIFILMTMDTIKDRNQQVVEKLTGRGLYLLRAFEAGTRIGVMGFRWKAGNVQRLLYETARQPGVVYLMITSGKGKILADSDPSKTGSIYKNMPDIKILDKKAVVYHRVIVLKTGKKIFEVFKRFTPARQQGYGIEGTIDLRQRRITGSGRVFQEKDTDWCRMHFFAFRHGTGKLRTPAKQFVFAGLSMDRVEAMNRRFLRHAVIMGCVLFFIGCGGIVTLFIFQAYRSAKSSLSKVQAFSDRIVETMPAGLVTVDTSFSVTSFNKSAWWILSFCERKSETYNKESRSEKHSEKRSESSGGDDLFVLPGEMTELAKEIKADNKNIAREIECMTNCGDTVLLDVNVSSITDDSGKISGFLFLFRDLTELKKLEKELERNKRLAAVGKLAAGVAHEIRNPLSSIKGFATYFKERYKDVEDDRKIAEIMINEVERLNRSVTELLRFAKSVPVSKKKVRLSELLYHSVQLVRHDLDKRNIKAVININTKKDFIVTDPDRINQILLNLYLNALDAMNTGGLLSIGVSSDKKGNYFIIRVEDTGRGIDKDDLDHIFDPYFTTRPDGTGLGLAMVHSAVEALEGSISVESEKGTGTVFTMKFPG